MPIRSRNLLRARKIEHIPASRLTGVGVGGILALTLAEGAPNTWAVGVQTGTVAIGGFTAGVALEVINSTGMIGLKMSTNGNKVVHDWLVPSDLDQAYAVNVRANWATESTTTTHGALFTVKRTALVRNTTALTATISTALDTIIPADLVASTAAAYAIHTTNKGVINANSLTAGEHQELETSMTTKTGATNIWLLGLEIEYVPNTSGQMAASGPVVASTWP